MKLRRPQTYRIPNIHDKLYVDELNKMFNRNISFGSTVNNSDADMNMSVWKVMGVTPTSTGNVSVSTAGLVSWLSGSPANPIMASWIGGSITIAGSVYIIASVNVGAQTLVISGYTGGALGSTAFTGPPGVAFTVNHQLNHVPYGFSIVRTNTPCHINDSGVAWTAYNKTVQGTISLLSNVGGVSYTLMIY